MNLILDQGNTAVKMAVFSDDKMIVRFTEKTINAKILKDILHEYDRIDKSIWSSVVGLKDDVLEILTKSVKQLIILDENTPLPIKNYYFTKHTLGYDRIANAVGARTVFPDTDVLVIDAGTAITFDLVTADGEFAGGNISPGLSLRFKALHQFTGKLPLVERKDQYPLLGHTTHDAVLSGVMTSVINEIDGYIHTLRDEYPDLQIILSGGDADFLVKKLKNIIFVDQNITLTGLNRILEYNAE